MARHRRPGRSPTELKDHPSNSLWSLAFFLTLLGVAAAVTAWGYYRGTQARAQRAEMLKSLGTDGQYLFSSLDTDRDLSISPEEFKPIAKNLRGIKRD